MTDSTDESAPEKDGNEPKDAAVDAPGTTSEASTDAAARSTRSRRSTADMAVTAASA